MSKVKAVAFTIECTQENLDDLELQVEKLFEGDPKLEHYQEKIGQFRAALNALTEEIQ